MLLKFGTLRRLAHALPGILLVCFGSVVSAQPFTTVINVPPDIAPGSIGSDTRLNLFDGGEIGGGFNAGATDGTSTNVRVDIGGGSVGLLFNANAGSTINISGGFISGAFKAGAGSTINITGTHFVFDGVDLTPSMSPGSPMLIDTRGAILSGELLDGSAYNFTVQSLGGWIEDIFSDDAVLSIILAGLYGDLNGDGFVGIGDLNIVLGNWNQSVAAGDPLLGDPSGDGFVGIEDLNAVLGNWNAGSPPTRGADIPEPGAVGVVAVGVAAGALCRKRRRVQSIN